MDMSARDRVRDFVGERLRLADAGTDFTDTDSLFVSGRLDSLSTVQFVAFLESEFGIDFAELGFDVTMIDSVDAIMELVERQEAS